jgi:radical SAM protein with 4Fe4S-binding SPASM domain
MTSPPPRPRARFESFNINDGKGVMFVGYSGFLYPSGFLPIVCGKFPRDNVVRVYQDSALFRDLRDPNRLEGKCGVCEFRKICGGSRARACAVTGNPFAEEPDCVHIPSAMART